MRTTVTSKFCTADLPFGSEATTVIVAVPPPWPLTWSVLPVMSAVATPAFDVPAVYVSGFPLESLKYGAISTVSSSPASMDSSGTVPTASGPRGAAVTSTSVDCVAERPLGSVAVTVTVARPLRHLSQ